MVKQTKIKIIFLTGIILILILAIFGMIKEIYSLKKENINEEVNLKNAQTITNKIDNKLSDSNNLGIKNKDYKKTLIAVMLDNFKLARPISSLNKAIIVYEAPVEADITRFLAIFDNNDLPQKIGPVRSSRPYFLDWASAYAPIYIHAGGSPEALDKINRHYYNIYNIDALGANGIYFWRDSKREAPNNLYIYNQSINKLIKNKKISIISKLNIEKYQGKIHESENTVSTVKIDYLEPVVWTFDKKSGYYLRSQAGKKFFDENGNRIKTKNLIIEITDISMIPQDLKGRKSIRTIGRGKAFILQNGNLIKGTWEKLTKNSQTVFYNSKGEKIKFIPGQIWINIVSSADKISIIKNGVRPR